MQIKNKLAILELIAGICGWGWIIAEQGKPTDGNNRCQNNELQFLSP